MRGLMLLTLAVQRAHTLRTNAAGSPPPPAPPPPAPPPSGGTGTFTTTWEAPALDGDGGTLSDLANFEVRWGTQTGVYTQTSGLLSSSTLTYTASGLTNGQTVYVTVVAIDSAGNESNFAIERTKAIP